MVGVLLYVVGAPDFEGGAGVRRRRWRRIGPKRAAPWGVAAAHTTHVCSRERGAGHRFQPSPASPPLGPNVGEITNSVGGEGDACGPPRLARRVLFFVCFVLVLLRAGGGWREPHPPPVPLHPWLNVVRV